MMGSEQVERARQQHRIESYIDELPTIMEVHEHDKPLDTFSYDCHEPTREERAEFFAEFGVRLAYTPKV